MYNLDELMLLYNITNGRLSFPFLKHVSLKLKFAQKNQESESHQPLSAVVWDFFILCLFTKLILSDPFWVEDLVYESLYHPYRWDFL